MLVFLFLAGAAAAVSIGVSTLAVQDWQARRYLAISLPKYIFFVFPYFWLAPGLISIFFAYYFFVRTKNGYKYGHHAAAFCSASLILILGVVFAGKIMSVDDQNNFSIIDRSGKIWRVKIDFVSIPWGVPLNAGEIVRLVGKTKEGNLFFADISGP